MILIKPPLTVSDEAFRVFQNLDASKKVKFDLSDVPADTVVILAPRVSGDLVVGEYVAELKAFQVER